MGRRKSTRGQRLTGIDPEVEFVAFELRARRVEALLDGVAEAGLKYISEKERQDKAHGGRMTMRANALRKAVELCHKVLRDQDLPLNDRDVERAKKEIERRESAELELHKKAFDPPDTKNVIKFPE